MRQWIRSHLTYANVVATLSLFLVVGGGSALGAYVISSNSQVGPGTISGHKPPTGKHANIIAGSINGQDIADRSGVDTCQGPLTAKYGPICAGSDGGARTWQAAANYCAGYGLRLPSYSEAHALAVNYDVPGVSDQVLDGFWTDDYWKNSDGEFAEIVNEAGNRDYDGIASSDKTVCVTDPSA